MSPDTKKAARFKPDRDVKRVEGRLRALRHPEGGVRRLPGRGRADRPPGRRLLLPRRAGRHAQDMVGQSTRSTSPRRPSPSWTGRAPRPPTGRRTTPRRTPRSTSGFFEPEQWFGVHQPIDTAQDFVIGPLRTLPNQPVTQAAVNLYQSASPGQQHRVDHRLREGGRQRHGRQWQAPGPRRALRSRGLIVGSLTDMAQTGGLDGTLLSEGQFYNTNYTKPLLFLADGNYLANLADAQHLSGDQWGMMNETGNYPGQAWLWLYTMWYQVPPMNSSTNGDLEVWVIMMVLSVG